MEKKKSNKSNTARSLSVSTPGTANLQQSTVAVDALVEQEPMRVIFERWYERRYFLEDLGVMHKRACYESWVAALAMIPAPDRAPLALAVGDLGRRLKILPSDQLPTLEQQFEALNVIRDMLYAAASKLHETNERP